MVGYITDQNIIANFVTIKVGVNMVNTRGTIRGYTCSPVNTYIAPHTIEGIYIISYRGHKIVLKKINIKVANYNEIRLWPVKFI